MDKNKTKDWICFLDEYNEKHEIFIELIHVDSSFVKFKTTGGNLITIPSCRILKIKERGVEE